MSTHEDRWLQAKLAEGEQRKAAMREQAERIRKQIRQARERGEEWPRITPEVRDDYSQAREDNDWWLDVDSRGRTEYSVKED